MPSTKELRRRIRSVKSTAQITKAMQMVAATKMRRAQNQALNGRPYSQTLQLAVAELMPAITRGMNPLLQQNSSTKTAILLLTTDKSLCGALNANVIRLAQQFSRDNKEAEFFTIGKKGRDYIVKSNKNLSADFENTDVVEYKKAKQTANVLIQSYLENKYGEVYILYPDFVSTLKQEPKLEKILPISQTELLNGLNSIDNNNMSSLRRQGPNSQSHLNENVNHNENTEFIFDTSKQQLLDFVLTHFIHQKVYQAMLELKASEHSARMIAMKNATDSAQDLVQDLNLAYNRTRQEGITKELLEITSALAALE